MKTTERIFDALTGKETVIEREETTQEATERQEAGAKLAAILKIEAEAQIKRDVAVAKLEALGLTADDLKALGL